MNNKEDLLQKVICEETDDILNDLEVLQTSDSELNQEIADYLVFNEILSQALCEERSNPVFTGLVNCSITNEVEPAKPDEEFVKKVQKKLSVDQKPIKIKSQRKLARKNKKRQKKSNLSTVFIFAAVAACLLIFLGISYMKSGSNPPVPELTAGEVRSSDGVKLRDLKLSDTIKTQANQEIVLQLKDGSKVTVKSDSSLKYSAGDESEFYLMGGSLKASVSKQKTGKVIFKSAHLRAEIVGTEFTFSTSRNHDLFELHEGEVNLQSSSKKVTLKGGDSVKVNSNGQLERIFNEAIQELTLVQLPNGKKLRELWSVDTVNFAKYKQNLNVEITTSKDVLRLEIFYKGKMIGEETGKPFYLLGDFNNKIKNWNVSPGKHKYTVKAYSRKGKLLQTKELRFRVLK